MQGYWLTFTDGSHGYCQGYSAYDAVCIAEKLTNKKVDAKGSKYDPEVPTLPYPADPVIWQLDHPVNGKTLNFCFRPEQCKGETSCPHNRACTE